LGSSGKNHRGKPIGVRRGLASSLLLRFTITPSPRPHVSTGNTLDLGLDWSDQKAVVADYVTELVSDIIAGQCVTETVLCILKDLCVELDYDKGLYSFYLLYFAKADLEEADFQPYWDGANKSNIDSIIIDYCKQWIRDNRH